MYQNLCEKYGVTESEIDAAVAIVAKNIGNIVNPMAMLAVIDLLTMGDITNTEPAPPKGEKI